MAFSKKTWKNSPDKSTPITAEELNRLETGVAAADAAAAAALEAAASKLTKSAADADYAPAAQAVPTGGSTGQVLARTADGTAWSTPSSGGGGGTPVAIETDPDGATVLVIGA